MYFLSLLYTYIVIDLASKVKEKRAFHRNARFKIYFFLFARTMASTITMIIAAAMPI